MNNPFFYTPSEECNQAFCQLLKLIDSLKESSEKSDRDFYRELQKGKMLGVLIAESIDGTKHTLFAFSGQAGKAGFHRDGFVGPVFDYLKPKGHFKRKEAEISKVNKLISDLSNELSQMNDEMRIIESFTSMLINQAKEKLLQSKSIRDKKRQSGISTEEEEELIKQSQFEKAEFQRFKQKLSRDIEPSLDSIKEIKSEIDELKTKRHLLSEKLQNWLFSNFKLLNAKGETESLIKIFKDTPFETPPSGAGECCAPKLLHAAYSQGLRPLSIAEYWYGASKEGDIRIQGHHYPACRGKCLPVLRWMLQGECVNPPLEAVDASSFETFSPEIIFENEWFCVIDKPAGMLSVAGKNQNLSLEEWLRDRYPDKTQLTMVHRLDQDTSGLIIASFDAETHKLLQRMFAQREIKKEYIADLDGNFQALAISQRGSIHLKLAPDIYDRPRQRIDIKDGKEAITDYEFVATSGTQSRVIFYPHTGRTHQLRITAAATEGLNMPIIGDRLYGRRCQTNHSQRLHLHASRIEFTFPINGEHYVFTSPLTTF